MKKIKFIMLSGLVLISTFIVTSNPAFATFSQSDLTGVWYGHTLTSGNEEVWEHDIVTIDSQGNVSVEFTDPGGTGSESNVAVLTISKKGIVTITSETSFHGVMSPDKNIVAFTDTWEGGDTYAITFLIKSGGSFSPSDLTGTWYIHSLTCGSEEIWQYGTATIDSAGNVSVEMTDSDGESDSADNVALVSIDSNGIISDALEPSFHGAMSPDKNFVAITETWEEGDPYNLMILVKGGGSFTLSDLKGTWYGHTLVSGSGGQGWEYSTITIDGQGVASASFTDSDGGSDSGSVTLGIDSSGIISVSGVSTSHGVMNLDKNIAVFTETGGTNEYHLMVLIKEEAAAPGMSWLPLLLDE